MPNPESPTNAHPITSETLRQIVCEIIATRPDEIDCPECFEQLDCFAELILAGQDVQEVMPHIQEHLDRCRSCREEFEALMRALQAQQAGM